MQSLTTKQRTVTMFHTRRSDRLSFYMQAHDLIWFNINVMWGRTPILLLCKLSSRHLRNILPCRHSAFLEYFLKFNWPEMKGSAFPRPCIWSHGFIYLPFQYNVILIGVICSEFRVFQLFSIFEVVCVKSASSVLLQIHLSRRTSLSNVLQALLQWVQPAWSNISLPYVVILFPKPNNSYTIGWNSHCGKL